MTENKQDQQIGVPLGIYKDRYRALDPAEISQRTGIPFDAEKSAFLPTVLGFQLAASWPEFNLTPLADGCPDSLYGGGSQILIIRYLIEGVGAPHGGGFIPYRELPWGEVYDRNFQGRCIKRLAFGFGSRLGDFERAARQLGGTARQQGDVSYDLPFLDNLIVRMTLWAGDDEFPPTSQILFSDNTPLAFSAEDAAVIGDVVIGALKELSAKSPA